MKTLSHAPEFFTVRASSAAWLFPLALLLALPALADDVTTSKGTRTLPPFEGLTTDNSLKQAGRIADIALGELLADGAALEKVEAALNAEVEAYKVTQKADQAQFDDLKAQFNARNAPYVAGVARFDGSNAVLTEEVMRQRAEAMASNSLPATQRNPATVDRLTRWAVNLGQRRARLDQERDLLVQERVVVENQRLAAQSFWDGSDARLRTAYAAMQARFATLKAKQGLAYRQLKLCVDYATSIKERLKTPYDKSEIRSPVLDGAMEQLKAMAARGFDGN
jgi:hypothetical protein